MLRRLILVGLVPTALIHAQANPRRLQNTTNNNVFDNDYGLTVMNTLQTSPQFSQFAQALAMVGLDTELSDNSKRYTVFAPSNTAIEQDSQFEAYTNEGWRNHLRANLQLMIVPDQALLDIDIFDRVTAELVTLNGSLAVSQPFAKINLVGLEVPNLEGSNGVVHEMSAVIKTDWREYTLRDVIDQEEDFTAGLLPILSRIRESLNIEPLNEFVPLGTSFMAPLDSAFEFEEAISLGYWDIIEELQNEDDVEFQRQIIMYNLIDQNFYEEDIPVGFQELFLPRDGTSHMLVTKHTDGILRFNDAELDRQVFAGNGITQIVKKPLVPPGIVMLLQYLSDFSDLGVSQDMLQHFKSSGWNPRDLAESVGTGDGSFTLFAPAGGYSSEEFSIETAVRYATLEWRRHLWDLLLHLITEPARTADEWYQMVEEAGGSLPIKMLSDSETSLEIDDDGNLFFDGSRLLGPQDIKGIDGYIQRVGEAPLPPSVLYTINDRIAQNAELRTLQGFIDTVKLGVFIDNLLPVTVIAPLDSAWENRIVPVLEIEDVLKNHIFELLWFDDQLAELDGETLASVNGKEWTIQVFDDPAAEPLRYAPEEPPVKIYISNTEGPEGLTNCSIVPGSQRTNILGRTGIMHHVDCLLLDSEINADDSVSVAEMPTTLPSNDAAPTMIPSVVPSEAPPAPSAEPEASIGTVCEEWFTNGPLEFTGNDPSASVSLICSEYTVSTGGPNESLNSIVFGCRTYAPGVGAPEGSTSVHFFNEECMASTPTGEFRCYQNNPDTGYSDFLSQAARMNPPSCDSEVDGSEVPQFWYNTQAEREEESGKVVKNDGAVTGVSSAFFDIELAGQTMISRLTVALSEVGVSSPAINASSANNTSEDGVLSPAINASSTNDTLVPFPTANVSYANESESDMPTPYSLAPSMEDIVVVVNTSYDVFNTAGLTAEDLNLPENRVILIEAFSAFIDELIAERTAGGQQRLLQILWDTTSIWHRCLDVSLQLVSVEIYNIIDVECQAESAVRIPDNADCQSVSGGYNLAVSADEDTEKVKASYSEAVREAIEEGKMQESLEVAAQNSPLASLNVSGASTSASTSETATSNTCRSQNLLISILLALATLLQPW